MQNSTINPSYASGFIPADDKRLEYSDYADLTFVASPNMSGERTARMSRPLDCHDKGYNFDNPGARLRFMTDAEKITVHLYYNDRHTSDSARIPDGIYMIDGKMSPEWKFTSKSQKTIRKPETLELVLDSQADKKMHCYEVIMPYGDSVDINGVTVMNCTDFTQPPPRPTFRCLCYGDSVTQGFTAGDISNTYAFLLGHHKNWQTVNMATGGRASNPDDGNILGKYSSSMLTVLIGVNDWQGGVNVEKYHKNMIGFIKNFRNLQPQTPVVLITPLWVPPSWKPEQANIPLEEYRKMLRKVASELKDPNIQLIEGPELIDHDDKYFDRVAVHPNNAGFKMMAERLSKNLEATK